MQDTAPSMTVFAARLLALIFMGQKAQLGCRDYTENDLTALLLFLGNSENVLSAWHVTITDTTAVIHLCYFTVSW